MLEDVAAEHPETLVITHFVVDTVFVPGRARNVDLNRLSQRHRQERAKPQVVILTNEVHLVNTDLPGSVAADRERFWRLSQNYRAIVEAN